MPMMMNSDLSRLLKSQEIRRALRPKKLDASKRKVLKKNPLKNIRIMFRLNPYYQTQKRQALLQEERAVAQKKAYMDKKRGIVPAEEPAAKVQKGKGKGKAKAAVKAQPKAPAKAPAKAQAKAPAKGKGKK